MYSMYWYDMQNNVFNIMHFEKFSEAINSLKKLKKAYKGVSYSCMILRCNM